MKKNHMQQRFRKFLDYLKKHPKLTNCVLVFLSVVFILLLFEIGFRVYITQTQPDMAAIIKRFTWETAHEKTRQRFTPHPYLAYAPSSITYKKNGIQINGEFFAFAKPKNTLRIACLGGSTTMGQYPQYLKNHLTQLLSHPYQYEIMDFGCDGWTLMESTINYIIRIQDLQPDFVIVHHGMNDLAGRMWPNYKPDYTHYRKTYNETILGYISREYLSFSWMTTFLLFRSGQSSIDIINLTTYTIPHDRLNHNPGPKTLGAFARNLKTLNAVISSRKGQLIYAPMAYNPKKAEFYNPKLIDEFNQCGIQVARDNNIAIADTHSLLIHHPNYFKDLVHLSPEGNQIKAKEFAKIIAKMIDS